VRLTNGVELRLEANRSKLFSSRFLTCNMSGQFTPNHALFVNGLARIIGAVELKDVLGNINAQHTNSQVDLPSEVKVHQTKSSLEDPAGLAA
jgi:hypothetical protein